MIKKYGIAACLSTLIFLGCDGKENTISEDKVPEVINKTVIVEPLTKQSYNLKTSDNKSLTIIKDSELWNIDGINDKVILLDFFATWCPPCKAEIPHLNNLYKTYKDKFEIVGILLEDGKSNEDLKLFMDEFKIEYTITNDPRNQELASMIGNIRSIPTMFLINQDGKIIQKYVGIVPEEMLASDIKKALKK
jgi:thiol-disulfide isomerase/thioredoxin